MLPRKHPDRIQITFDDHRLVANAGPGIRTTVSMVGVISTGPASVSRVMVVRSGVLETADTVPKKPSTAWSAAEVMETAVVLANIIAEKRAKAAMLAILNFFLSGNKYHCPHHRLALTGQRGGYDLNGQRVIPWHNGQF